MERVGHLVRHRHAPARQRQDEDVGAIGVVRKLPREQLTRVPAIAKEPR
jgi:hypothetical protein